MKRYLVVTCLALLAVLTCTAQTADPNDDATKLLALAKEVQAQQTQIADNQTKLEAKLAELTETLRVARIYSSRSR